MSARLLRFFALGWFAVILVASVVRAAVATPPPPAAHFNDYANFVPADRGRALDARLAQFERDTSTQLVVAIYPRLPAGAALEDYTVRAAQAWGVGQKKRDNGAVLFVFVADRSLRIEVGYGLEGSLTDALAHQIIENDLKPLLRAGRTADAMDAAITSMIAATRGEYRAGTAQSGPVDRASTAVGQSPRTSPGSFFNGLFFIFIVIAVIISWFRNGFTFQNPNRRGGSGGSWGGWSGGGSSGGGGGGFSGGGGSFGGGGASGKW